MKKNLAYMTAVFCILAFVGSAMAGVPPWWNVNNDCVIHYDGYLHMHVDPAGTGVKIIRADTLIVVTNTGLGSNIRVAIDVFDKYGKPVVEGATLLNGGDPIDSIPASGFGWITLAQLVTRTTDSPYPPNPPDEPEDGLAEKFSYRIWAQKSDLVLMPVVEVKQMVYEQSYTLEYGQPYRAPWTPEMFKLWTETSLGGRAGTGVVWP
jgi:hypothetical protein